MFWKKKPISTENEILDMAFKGIASTINSGPDMICKALVEAGFHKDSQGRWHHHRIPGETFTWVEASACAISALKLPPD